MGNTDFKNGLMPRNVKNYEPQEFVCDASIIIKPGDTLYLNSGGYPVALAAGHTNGYPILGVAAGWAYDPDGAGDVTREKATVEGTTVAGDKVPVWNNPDIEFVAQIATGARTDPYTTSVSASCFDLAGSAGAQYVDNAASTYDDIRVMGPAEEEDAPASNQGESQYGVYQKVRVKLNPNKHYLTKTS